MKNYLKKSANFASWKELFSKKCEFHCEFERIIRESCQNSANDQLKEAMKQSAISASDRRRLSEEAAADGADDGEEEEAIDAEAGSAD